MNMLLFQFLRALGIPVSGFHRDGDTVIVQQPKKARRSVGGPVARTLINLAVTAATGLVWFYVALPPLNFQAEEFYFFLFLLCAVYCLCAVFTSGFQDSGVGGYFRFVRKQCRIPFYLVVLMMLVIAVGSIASWVVLRAGSYSALLPLTVGDFTTEVEEIRYDRIPMLDADSAGLLGNRKLGELADMVSQFEILPAYGADATDGALSTTQINYQGRPVRVASLAYGDIIKWFNNRAKGLPAYIIIDMVTREAEVIRLEQGMRYTVAEHFNRNLYRHLRFHYPAMMFDIPVFEIDEEGTPWWVCPRIVKRIGLFGGLDVRGAVLVNAVTGESTYYEEVPAWVDRLYSADIIVRQYDYYGRYHNGFLNSLLGQRDVTVTTTGWNYIALEDDVYMYTGVTSVTSDESNIGFILTNQRTKETEFFSIAGAEEYSAMDSAQSQVQQMRYIATFPLLLNVADQPTYFMALKGQDGLVKMYAMVNVQQYDIVSTGSTVGECEGNYRNTLAARGIIRGSAEQAAEDLVEQAGTVSEILTSVIGGNTHYYIRVEGSTGYLDFNAAEDPLAALLTVGDRIRFSCAVDGLELEPRTIVPASRLSFDGGAVD
ncbi:MAG: CvpA family protein [Oscillibacter sp.]|nr:CvpA family protein [Oscillibacter sp.]